MNKTNLSAYMAMTVSQLKEEQRMGTAHVYQSTLNRIKDFMEQDSISFEEVTPVWLKAFQEYLLERQLHWNTISTYMRMLRATYFRAVDDGLAPYQPRLFKGVYTGTKVTVKRAVDEDVFRQLNYNPQIQISAESETKRSIFREKDKTKRSKKESAQHSKSRNKSFVMTSVSAL